MAKNEKSVTDLVCEHIKKQKLLPIPVQTLNEEAEATRYFGGDLKEFLAAAKTLGAKGIFVETLYLEDDEFYPKDLVGLEARLKADGRVLGKVVDMIEGAQWLLKIRLAQPVGDETTALVPFVINLVPDIDLEEGYLTIDPPGGLIPGV